MNTTTLTHSAPLNGPAVKSLEEAISRSRNRIIQIEVNNTLYQLSQEGNWFKFSLLTKKRAIKRSTLFETMTQLYNQVMHGNTWRLLTN